MLIFLTFFKVIAKKYTAYSWLLSLSFILINVGNYLTFEFYRLVSSINCSTHKTFLHIKYRTM